MVVPAFRGMHPPCVPYLLLLHSRSRHRLNIHLPDQRLHAETQSTGLPYRVLQRRLAYAPCLPRPTDHRTSKWSSKIDPQNCRDLMQVCRHSAPRSTSHQDIHHLAQRAKICMRTPSCTDHQTTLRVDLRALRLASVKPLAGLLPNACRSQMSIHIRPAHSELGDSLLSLVWQNCLSTDPPST